MQNTVVSSAIRSEVHSTLRKVGSLRNRLKFSRVKLKVIVPLPDRVTAYSRIMIIGATMNSAIHSRYG